MHPPAAADRASLWRVREEEEAQEYPVIVMDPARIRQAFFGEAR